MRFSVHFLLIISELLANPLTSIALIPSATSHHRKTNTYTMSAPKVAVIGGGAAGLAAARVLSRNGIRPYVFEKDLALGGVWRHVAGSETRPMYLGLRTNLPREIMGYREKPWGSNGIGKSYVTHQEVCEYLQEYEADFDLGQFIAYGAKVTQLTIHTDSVSSVSPHDNSISGNDAWPKITLEWEELETATSEKRHDTFDAVCVCNGHYAAAATPTFPGLHEHFKGKIMHSVEYDDPSIFAGKTVLCIGGRASGSDLAKEISGFAKKVYLSDSTCPPIEDGQPHTLGNVAWVPRTMSVEEGSVIRFDESCAVAPTDVDVIIVCTGYDYSFPFINKHSQVDLQVAPGERRIAPLYEHLWHAKYPNLSFVGVHHSVVPFPYFELQAEAIVAQLKGSTELPSLESRVNAAKIDADSGGPNDPGRVQDTHFLGSNQWDYCLKMAKMAGDEDSKMEDFIATNKAIYEHAGSQRKNLFPGGPDTYRANNYVRNDSAQSFEWSTDSAEREDAEMPLT